eukprot:624011-Prymnesium_polylepis.2
MGVSGSPNAVATGDDGGWCSRDIRVEPLRATSLEADGGWFDSGSCPSGCERAGAAHHWLCRSGRCRGRARRSVRWPPEPSSSSAMQGVMSRSGIYREPADEPTSQCGLPMKTKQAQPAVGRHAACFTRRHSGPPLEEENVGEGGPTITN